MPFRIHSGMQVHDSTWKHVDFIPVQYRVLYSTVLYSTVLSIRVCLCDF